MMGILETQEDESNRSIGPRVGGVCRDCYGLSGE